MKKSIFLHISACAALALASCSNKLDVQPDTLVSPDQVNSSNVGLVLNGSKLALTNNAFYNYYILPEIMGDDVQTAGLQGYELCNIPVNDNSAGIAYRYPFACINNTNMVIRYFNAHSTEAALRPIAGEAYLLRAYAYMLLHEQFGKVAIMDGTEDPLTYPDRQPEEKVKAEIEDNLLKAAELLPDYEGKSMKGSKQAAQLLLARHYLNNGKNTEAATLANAVIGSGKFSLQDNKYEDVFKYNTTTKEVVYAIAEVSAGTNNTKQGLPGVFGPGNGSAGGGTIWIDSNLVKSYEDTDIRKAFYVKVKGRDISDLVWFLIKFPEEAQPSYPVCRYSEAFLIAAEAKARTGTVDVTRYNELRTMRKASVSANSDFASPAAFLEAIEWERRREFVGERHRWSDMRRFGKAIPWLTGLQQPAGHVLFPIPERLFTLNPTMQQNDDY
ncbi:RagB/SusD family nutrient uptake outer membrane protein [Chitinophaga deserti]|uniref:RagB/SusD family nutrient uptake outer membrane protein n=1 Tax=Chitinophaga deserti TaxID=2164099 RepID=UPI000D6D06F6|nr:RagB/SusD family nutrient uptake outer membrane protein [Chitinophaga deserti]